MYRFNAVKTKFKSVPMFVSVRCEQYDCRVVCYEFLFIECYDVIECPPFRLHHGVDESCLSVLIGSRFLGESLYYIIRCIGHVSVMYSIASVPAQSGEVGYFPVEVGYFCGVLGYCDVWCDVTVTLL